MPGFPARPPPIRALNRPRGGVSHTLPVSLNPFGIEGYLAVLIGNRAPYEARHQATAAERAAWNHIRATLQAQADQGLTVAEALHLVRAPQWQWAG